METAVNGMRCKVCDSSLTILEDRSLRLYRCKQCGHVFKNLAEEVKEKYEEGYFSSEHRNWFENPDYALFDFIHKQIARQRSGETLKVFDAGCGRGELLKYLKKKNPELELYGIDFAKNDYPGIRFIQGDFFTSRFDIKFDVIINVTVIEHLNNPHEFIKKAGELLLPGGILITVTDNDDSLMYGIARLAKKMGAPATYDRLYSTHHLQCFSRHSLKTIMDTNGLEPLVHYNRNHPVRAVDYPPAGPIMAKLYKLAVCGIFFLSALLGNGILQVMICRKE